MRKPKSFARNRLSQAITLACLSSVTAGTAFAGTGSCVDGDNIISTAVATECSLDTGDSLQITDTGVLTSVTSGVWLDGNQSIGAITNAGTIDASNHGIYVYGRVGGAGIVNSGYLNAGWNGIYAYNSNITAIENSGIINASNAGIYVFSAGRTSVVGSVTNSGTIVASGGKGMYLYGDINGDVTNSGTIDSNYTGIYLFNSDVSGNVVNSGFIGSNYGRGFYIHSSDIAGNVTNSGVMDVDDGGIYLYRSDVGGTVENSGTINAGDFGIYVFRGDVGGSVINSGTILSSDGGIYIQNSNVGGNVVNSGSIDVDSYSHGIYIHGSDIGGNVLNSGSMTLYSGTGIYVHASRVSGDVENSGTIAYSSTYNNDKGMYVFATVDGNVVNSGTINMRDTGIYVFSSDIGGSLVNSGVINSVNDKGVYINGANIGGSVINSGTVNSSDAGFYIHSSDIAGNLVNSGTISTSDYGVYVLGSDIGGSVVNSGTIDSSYSAFYMYNSDVGGQFLNSGTIDAGGHGLYAYNTDFGGPVTNSGHMDVSSTGLYLYRSDVNGNVTNSGTILAGYKGIYVFGNVAGNVLNSGHIDSSDTGIYVHQSNIAGSVINSGTILSGDKGIYINGGTVGGSVVNSGTINVSDTGIYVYGVNLDGGVINSGTITSGDKGIYINGDVSGNVVNSGTISSSNSGIYLHASDIAGSIVNSGTISATDSSIYLHQSEVGGSLINSGQITADYRGVYLHGTELGGSLVNSGTISAGYQGIYLSDGSSVAGQILNSGTIASDYAGIYIHGSSVGRSVVNSGLISTDYSGIYLHSGAWVQGSVVNSGTINGGEYGIYSDGYSGTNAIDGSIVNSGTITSAAGYDSIYVTNTDVQGNVSNFGRAYGSIYVEDVNVSNSGLIHSRTDSSEVTGDYSQSGDFRVTAVSNANYGDLTVGGTAAFAQGSKLSVEFDPAHTLISGDVLNDVITAGTLNAANLALTDNLIAYSFSKTIDGNTVDVTVVETGLTTVYASTQAQGFSQGYGVAKTIDGFIASDPNGDIAFAFGGYNTDQEMANAVEAVMPALGGGVAQASLISTGDMTDVVSSRQAGQQGLSSGDEVLLSKHFWLAPFGGSAEQSERDGISGYEIDTTGVSMGGDVDLSDSWNVGLALGYAQSDIDSDISGTGQEVESDLLITKVYGTYRFDDRTNLRLQGGWGEIENDSTRVVAGGDVAQADYDATVYQASVQLERSYDLGEKTTVSPYALLDYSKVEVDSYTETGAGALNLSVEESDADEFILGVGAAGSHAMTDDLFLLGNLGIGYDMETDPQDVTSSFSGARFTTAGFEPDELVYNLGLGTRYDVSSGTAVTFKYDYETREDYEDQYFTLKVDWKF